MNAREKHVEAIRQTKLEIRNANPKGVHIKDLRRKLVRLKRELLEYDGFMRNKQN